MLVLVRRVGESIHIGDDIVIEVESFENGNRVKIGIDAPRDVRVLRSELVQRERVDKSYSDATKPDTTN